MFGGSILWRGIVYAVLMIIGKLLCGLWLVRFPLSLYMKGLLSSVPSRYHSLLSMIRQRRSSTKRNSPETTGAQNQATEDSSVRLQNSSRAQTPPPQSKAQTRLPPTRPAKPLSLYPGGIVSCAMVARGEIGFLISATAESSGIFRSASERGDGGSEASGLFLIVTWAIVLCTVVGPICVGLLVRRVRRLENRSPDDGAHHGSRDVLGVWGPS